MDGNRQTGVVVNNTGRSGGVSGLPLEFVAGTGAEVWRRCCAGRAAGGQAACRGAVHISVFLTLPHSVASAIGHILRLCTAHMSSTAADGVENLSKKCRLVKEKLKTWF